MKYGWKQYWQPTPKNVRKWADGLLSVSTLAGTYAFVQNNFHYMAICFWVGVGGKFLSNFIGADQVTPDVDPQQN